MENPGTLFIVATPIGNLSDITLRALETLKASDLILAEDTRVTKKLLSHYEISRPIQSFHEHSDERKAAALVERLRAGENMALVTDAGTPGLSDPGNVLVEKALAAGASVTPIPGVSALTALVSVAGIDMREFLFRGFPPHKKGRQTFFREVAASEVPVMYYESPHRFVKNLELLASCGEKRLIVGRELTKMYEEVVRGSVLEVLAYFAEHPEKVKGEFSVIAYNGK
ncbi:MAG: 16S rRNA (cytidine(1402)-2'-O)-methyltransferase [Candidatus Moranbacteria bacterium RIFCSPHIGHO2_01_FULL_55_24]|nr:MAG: 16S rRNA (cytidine(1402)-2'-O)-methyltransferase [Candidatus Moranbacteria bacterium RIFCSPHIGHO2_01_FULL_55_24]